jgi:hypothetical protein
MSSAKPSGYGLMHIGGEDRPFQVGTNQGDHFQRLRRVSLKEYGDLFSPDNLRAQKLTGGDVRDFVYSALMAGYQNDGMPITFTFLDVGNWIDAPDQDENEVIKPLLEMLNQVVQKAEHAAQRAKNAQAPTPGPKSKAKKTN